MLRMCTVIEGAYLHKKVSNFFSSVLEIRMTMANRRLETVYLLADLIPIATFFLVGLTIFVVTGIAECCSHYKKPSDGYCTSCKDGERCSVCQYCCTKWTRKLSSFLIIILHGNGTQLVTEPSNQKYVTQPEEGQSNQEDNIMFNIQGYPLRPQHRRLRCFLSTNAIIITTLLFMIFADRYILTTEYGCIVGKDCYPLDGDFNEFPIENCTQFENSNITTVCYSFNLVFLNAMSDTGGILIMITLLTALMTKSIIYFLKNHGCDKAKRCCCCGICGWFYLIRVMIVAGVITAGTGYVVCIHKYVLHHQHNVPLRLAGSGMQYAAILLTFSITTLTPWSDVISKNSVSREEEPLLSRTSGHEQINRYYN